MAVSELPLSEMRLHDTFHRSYIRPEDIRDVRAAASDLYEELRLVVRPRARDSTDDSVNVVFSEGEHALISVEDSLAEPLLNQAGIRDEEHRRALSCWSTIETADRLDYTHGGHPDRTSFLVPKSWISLS